MKDIKWFVNRLRAMKPKEMIWRVEQKQLQKKEHANVYALNLPVVEIPLSSELTNLHIDIDKLSINWDNSIWTPFTKLDLFSAFDYDEYKRKWNAGFQTENTWPEEPFSPMINISQRVDIGDIRTNWELNRHYQFAALAKSYYCTKDQMYLSELKELFSDWNKHNLFLHGVEWTSAMELAIRVNSWVYTLAFLMKAGCEEEIIGELEHGILVMVDYIMKHRARFSSANNHLIVEMYSVALVGILTDYAPWKDEAIRILTEELPKQNYADGVNKEMSLHYQSFVMEAYGLLWLLMVKNQINIPEVWKKYLTAMSEFVSDSTDDCGKTMEFGDSDEGKILDLNGKIENHYQYVLNLMSCLLDQLYTDTPWHENLDWIVPQELKVRKGKYCPGLVCSRREGGYTFLRSKDRRVLIGIDHADLGYGSIAAHGHADALSFQLFIDGQPIFVDSGTYNYHVTPDDRNYFRSTVAHNTVMIENHEQSEMLGPFIWGTRAKAELVDLTEEKGWVTVKMCCSGSAGVHNRTIAFDQARSVEIRDDVGEHQGNAFFHFPPESQVEIEENRAVVCSSGKRIVLNSNGKKIKSTADGFSSKYGTKTLAVNLNIGFIGTERIVIQTENSSYS